MAEVTSLSEVQFHIRGDCFLRGQRTSHHWCVIQLVLGAVDEVGPCGVSCPVTFCLVCVPQAIISAWSCQQLLVLRGSPSGSPTPRGCVRNWGPTRPVPVRVSAKVHGWAGTSGVPALGMSDVSDVILPAPQGVCCDAVALGRRHR